MDWTGRLLPLAGYGSNTEYGSNSGYASTSSDLPQQQTVSLKDLDLGRWRPSESYGYDTSTSNDLNAPMKRLDTSVEAQNEESVEQSGDMSPTTYTSGIAFTSLNGDTSMSKDDTDDEPDLDSPMAYARFYGLRRDSLLDHPLCSDLIPLPPDEIYLDMEESPVLLRAEALQADALASLQNEKLDVDRDTATFLASLLGAAKRFELDSIDVVLEPEGIHRLKLELPLLAKDHEVEMLALRRRNEVRLCSEGIEPFQLDAEKDESIAFPRARVAEKLSLDRELENEKLDVSKETVELLRDLREVWSGKDANLLDELYESYKKGKAIRISPPLLPVTPPYSPSAPAPEAMQIELTSTPEDLIAKDAAAAEKEILDNHQVMDVTPLDEPLFNTPEISTAIDSYTAVPSSSPLARKRLRSLHLESPLTPHDHVESTSDEGSSDKRAKKLHFDPSLVALLPDMQPEIIGMPSEIVGQQEIELQDIIFREAESVQQQLQNEHLIDIDTTLRVRVPRIQPVQPQPPYELHGSNEDEAVGTSLQAQRTTLRYLSKEFLKDTRKWGGVTRLERTLPWAPFPSHLAKVDLHEHFNDDASLELLLGDLGLDDETRDIDIRSMVVRDLQGHESDDEEIEPAVFDDDFDGDAAEEELQIPEPERAFDMPLSIEPSDLSPKRLENLDPSSVRVQPIVPNPSVLPITATVRTSAATANLMQSDGLDHFMQLHGKASRPPKPVGKGLGRSTASSSVLSVPKPEMVPAAVMVPHAGNRPQSEPESATISIPIPEVKKFGTHQKIPIIVSSTFMAGNRRLLRLLQTTLPNIDICDRDATPAPSLSNSVGDPRTEEADLTISPSTGVVLTTLQKLKQKPLPGQQTSLTGSLRTRIASTAPLYERLIVLVKESSSNTLQPENDTASAVPTTTTNPLDHLDCTALADLAAWSVTTFSPAPEIQIHYIPGGDSEAANWLASAVSHHHHQEFLGATAGDNGSDDGSCLIRDETMWERWLRAAGLNAYAAQVVLRRLRLGDHPPDASLKPRFGLQAFIAMSLEERVEVFGCLLGGERVLREVSGVLDGGWRGGVVRWGSER